MMAAGIGFTGLSTAVAMIFDKTELSILSDVGDHRPSYQQLEHHRKLHSLPYLGGAIGAAHLIKHSASDFGRWVASQLEYPERAEDFIEALSNVSEWVIDSTGFGVLGHFMGDLPTKGHGGTALKLLKPITDHNFALGWVSHNNVAVQKYLLLVGAALTGAAWTFSGAYILSWEPPEQKIQPYLQRLAEYDTFNGMVQHILDDIQRVFRKAFQLGSDAVWSLPIFENSTENIRNNPKQNWFQMDINSHHFGIPSLSKQSLVKNDILPVEFTSPLTSKSLYDQEFRWPSPNGIPLVVNEENSMSLQTGDVDGTSIQTGNKAGTSIQSDDESGMSL
jgi:hypothetical protein